MNTDESQMQVLPDLTNMVSVQPEATVSRTVMHTEGGCPYVICQVRLMRGCVVSCRGLGACAGVVSVRGGVVVVVWVPPGW